MRKAFAAVWLVCAGLAPIVLIVVARAAIGAPVVLYNPSPSEPPGFYRLISGQPIPGRLIAFKVPEPGREYAQAHLAYVARNAILKEIAAGQGALVCESTGKISINGRIGGTVAETDRNGASLPHWSGCHHLGAGQYFVLSNRIPNSFDSRYYGPVSASDLLGVYRPLWTE